jgi:predicted O-methyltransferase YrrM
MGISAAYEAAAFQLAGAGHLVSIEGSPPSAQLAEQHLSGLGLFPAFVSVRTGRFADVLPSLLADTSDLDYVFIDGHHDEAATLSYFADCKPQLIPGATVVFDDIRWSAGMLNAWQQIMDDPDVAVSLDCGNVGIVAVDPGATGRVRASVRIG